MRAAQRESMATNMDAEFGYLQVVSVGVIGSSAEWGGGGGGGGGDGDGDGGGGGVGGGRFLSSGGRGEKGGEDGDGMERKSKSRLMFLKKKKRRKSDMVATRGCSAL